MADWTDFNFKWQYDFAKGKVADPASYAADWKDVVAGLKKLLGPSGFNVGEAKSIKKLREMAKRSTKNAPTMADRLLQAVNAGGNNAPALPDEQKLRASALKFLIHTYLLSSGKKTMWLHSAPKTFQHWESIHVNSWANTTGAVKAVLNAQDEQFSAKDKVNISACHMRSLNWVHKTIDVLGRAKTNKTVGQPSVAREKVKRWFADPSVTDAQLDTYIDTLSLGFKKIQSTLNKGTMILTDHMGLRGASTAAEIGFLNAEAFTYASRWEGLDVVYIEKSFFVNNPGNILPGEANWARILIHELTHLCCGTTDVMNGQARYAWYGIGPHAGYPGSQCITNADNWAFLAVDCGGGISQQQLTRALKII